MKKPFFLLLFLVLLSACQKSDISGEVLPTDETIAFVTEVQTKATPITNATINDFGVFCYYSDAHRWAEKGATTAPNKLCNVAVTKGADNKWAYASPVKWTDPSGKEVAAIGHFFHFFGYAPYESSSTIAVNTLPASMGAPTLTFTQPLAVTSQIDLLAARPRLDWQWGVGTTVPMQFEHMLARITFAVNVLEPESSSTYTITKILLKYNTDHGGFTFRKGNLNLKTRDWSDLSEPIAHDYQMVIPLNSNTQLTTALNSISSDIEQVLFIPQPLQPNSIEATFTVEKTASAGTMPTSKTLTTPLPATNWTQGKQYTYTYSVSFESTAIALREVEVVDWTTSWGGSMDIN